MCEAYAEKEVMMEPAAPWQSQHQGVGILTCLRSRVRTRRRRRKRAWRAWCADVLLVFRRGGAIWNRPALAWLASLFRRPYGRPAGHLCLMACGH
jgi:hypothetical protein